MSILNFFALVKLNFRNHGKIVRWINKIITCVLALVIRRILKWSHNLRTIIVFTIFSPIFFFPFFSCTTSPKHYSLFSLSRLNTSTSTPSGSGAWRVVPTTPPFPAVMKCEMLVVKFNSGCSLFFLWCKNDKIFSFFCSETLTYVDSEV